MSSWYEKKKRNKQALKIKFYYGIKTYWKLKEYFIIIDGQGEFYKKLWFIMTIEEGIYDLRCYGKE